MVKLGHYTPLDFITNFYDCYILKEAKVFMKHYESCQTTNENFSVPKNLSINILKRNVIFTG